jgi:hypothetical protein
MITVNDLEQVIARSEQFDDELFSMFQKFEFGDDNRSSAVVTMCNIAHEHAISLRELTRIRLLTSAMGMLRLQYEALVRAIWALYAASETAIDKLVAPLTPESEQAAKNGLPNVSKMMEDIQKKGPPGVHRHLSEFKDYSWQPLNSYVHGGIHAANRSNAGYPVNIHYSAVRQSNNLLHMSAIALAQLINDGDLAMEVVNLYKKHADCLQLT